MAAPAGVGSGVGSGVGAGIHFTRSKTSWTKRLSISSSSLPQTVIVFVLNRKVTSLRFFDQSFRETIFRSGSFVTKAGPNLFTRLSLVPPRLIFIDPPFSYFAVTFVILKVFSAVVTLSLGAHPASRNARLTVSMLRLAAFSDAAEETSTLPHG